MKDVTTEEKLKQDIIAFCDNVAACTYTFNAKTGYAYRSYVNEGEFWFDLDKKISYQLNPREKVPGRGGDISWTRTFPNNMKKLLSIGLTPVIRYNGKRRIANNKRLLNTIGNMLS